MIPALNKTIITTLNVNARVFQVNLKKKTLFARFFDLKIWEYGILWAKHYSKNIIHFAGNKT